MCLIRTYHGMKTSTIIMGGDEDMIGAAAAIPERILTGNNLDGGGQKRRSMSNSRKAINGAKITRNINRNEKEISFIRVQTPNLARQKSLMNCHLRSKQMTTAPAVVKPIGVELRRQIVHKHFQIIAVIIRFNGSLEERFWSEDVGIGDAMNQSGRIWRIIMGEEKRWEEIEGETNPSNVFGIFETKRRLHFSLIIIDIIIIIIEEPFFLWGSWNFHHLWKYTNITNSNFGKRGDVVGWISTSCSFFFFFGCVGEA